MSIHWSDGSGAIAAVFSAVTGGVALLATIRANRTADAANRTADAVARIERDRWHAELTPEFNVTATKLGAGVPRAVLRIELLGPAGLPVLDRVVLRVRDDGYARVPGPLLSQEMIDTTVFGPYRFETGMPGVSPDGRTTTSRPLLLGEWDQLSLERTPTPSWSVDDVWESQHGGHPVRLALECHAEGHRPWYVPYTVPVRDPNQPEPAAGPSA